MHSYNTHSYVMVMLCVLKTKTAGEALANLDPLSVTTKATIYESAHILDKAMNLEKVPCESDALSLLSFTFRIPTLGFVLGITHTVVWYVCVKKPQRD